ncbi:hypothetical protein CH063_00934 [Colletotrichum higginsianum]|uniref:Uncharacterized protein n=1 Tax=Colletotrichum higginsianum (strain IMI 349063) TaxID=759273 RepID=H1UYZ0_COLHI|nr:hypothetical protein CH063_00934 [Colletotrichum higginsianum]
MVCMATVGITRTGKVLSSERDGGAGCVTGIDDDQVASAETAEKPDSNWQETERRREGEGEERGSVTRNPEGARVNLLHQLDLGAFGLQGRVLPTCCAVGDSGGVCCSAPSGLSSARGKASLDLGTLPGGRREVSLSVARSCGRSIDRYISAVIPLSSSATRKVAGLNVLAPAFCALEGNAKLGKVSTPVFPPEGAFPSEPRKTNTGTDVYTEYITAATSVHPPFLRCR